MWTTPGTSAWALARQVLEAGGKEILDEGVRARIRIATDGRSGSPKNDFRKSLAWDRAWQGISSAWATHLFRSLPEKTPEAMYQRLMDKAGRHIDRCVLYVFRCAVYYASNETHDPEKLKWWIWKG